jgi:uncharacterized protein (DUF302 family)
VETRRVVVDLPFDMARAELMQALTENDVTIVSQWDVRQYLQRTVRHDLRRYLVLETAVPHVVLEALLQDVEAGAILPTTVALFELADGETALVTAEPFAGLGASASWRGIHPELAALADHACEHLARALRDFEQAARAYASIRAMVGT